MDSATIDPSSPPVRCRFAPSPTGELHIGSARTCLFNWLQARKHSGRFVLRIDDTDAKRSLEGAADSILAALEWLGITWDEGPLRQSDRTEIYAGAARRLIDSGRAYPCWCTPEELAERRRAALAAGRTPGYDRTCRAGRAPVPGARPAIRFAMPDSGTIVLDDLCRGRVAFDVQDLEDLVLLKADGTPTYNFATVVDDALMRITHVVRGDDLLNATPRQIALFEALGRAAPRFAHLPLVLGGDRRRLSKRREAVSVLGYRDQGYLPGAVLNAVARLGWSGGAGGREVFGVEEMVAAFSLSDLVRAAAVFDEERLAWLNGEHILRQDVGVLAALVVPFLARQGVEAAAGARLVRLVALHRRQARALVELADHLAPYHRDPPARDVACLRDLLAGQESLLAEAAERLGCGLDWTAGGIERALRDLAGARGVPLARIAGPLRVALTGRTVSAGLFELIEALGRDTTLRRLARARDQASEAPGVRQPPEPRDP
jgi:glutamyl-tRNA synthetase